MAHISITNSKLGAIPSLNLPVSICRSDAPCKGKGCYACKGNWKFANVQKSLQNNLAEFAINPDYFFNGLIALLNGVTRYKFFRWFGSGDIVNERFLQGMVDTAIATPQTKFLAFTKKFDLVNKYLDSGKVFPANLRIIFSAWDKDFEVENPYNLPVAYVYFKDIKLNPDIPDTAFPCAGKCEECLSCWSLVDGQAVVFNKH